MRYAQVHGGEFERHIDAAIFRANQFHAHMTQLRAAETEPLVVHTTVEPLGLRRLRFTAAKTTANTSKILIEDGLPIEDAQRVVSQEPCTWLDDLSRDSVENIAEDVNNAHWNRHLYTLRAASGIVRAVDTHFGTGQQSS